MSRTPREALREIRNRLVYLYGKTDGTFSPPALKEVCGIAEDALAEPERNCERFDNWDDAEAEYQRLVKEGKVEDGTWCEWLWDFAKEGGAS